MEILRIIFEIASAVVLVLAIFQKEKWKMMLMYIVDNLLLCAMFLAFGRYSTAIISVVGALRMLVFMIYALKNIKPNFIWLIVFESLFVVLTIVTWQDALDLMPMFALMASCLGSWQDNQSVLRLLFALNGVLYVVYEAIIGAYITLTVEIINLICTIFSFVYYCILKKETPIMQAIFKRKKQFKQDCENDKKPCDYIQ